MGVEYRHYLIPRNRLWRPSPEQLVALWQNLVTHGWLPRPPAGTEAYPFIEVDFEEDESEDIASHAYVRDGDALFPVPSKPSTEWTANLPRDCQIVFASENNSLAGITYPFTIQQDDDAALSWTVQLSEDLAYDSSYTRFSAPKVSLSKRVAGLFRRDKQHSAVLCSCGARLDYVTSVRDPIEPARVRVCCMACGRPFDPSTCPATVEDGYGTTHQIAGGLARRFSVIIDCEKAVPGRQGTFKIKPEIVSAVESTLGERLVEIPFWY